MIGIKKPTQFEHARHRLGGRVKNIIVHKTQLRQVK